MIPFFIAAIDTVMFNLRHNGIHSFSLCGSLTREYSKLLCHGMDEHHRQMICKPHQGSAILSNEWDQYAANWDVDPSVEEYSKQSYAELLNNVNIDGLRVLDFGCGTGSLTQLLSPRVRQIVAIDPSPEMIKFVEKKALENVSTVSDYLSETLIQRHPDFGLKFDLIVASSVCSFLPNYESTLTLLKSLLTPDGVWVQWDWLSTDETSEMGLTQRRVENAFQQVGFANTKISTPFKMTSSKGEMPVLMAIGKHQ